jgi:hypothetical protein
MIRLRRVAGRATLDGENVIFRNSTGQITACCNKAKDASFDAHDAVYALYFDPTTGCMIRLAQVMEEHGSTVLGLEVDAVQRIEEDPIRLLLGAVLAGERHEYNRSKPGGMD